MAADLKSALQSLRKDRTNTSPSPSLIQNTLQLNQDISNSSINISHVLEEDEEYDEIFKDIDLFNFSSDDVDLTVDSSHNPTHLSCTLNSSQSNEYNSRKRPLNHNLSSERSKKQLSSLSTPICAMPTNQVSLNSHSLNQATPTSVATSNTSTCMPRPSITPLSTPLLCPLTTPRPLTTPISCPLVIPNTSLPSSLSQKFPGPAGCLPKLNSFDRLDATPLPSPLPATPSSTPIIKKISSGKSTNNNAEFTNTNGPWIRMMNELDLTDPLSKSLLNINIETIITKAMRHQLSNGKVPHLRVLVKTLIPSTRSATAVLMDPSGDILATVHASVLEEYKTELVQGCAAILRQVSIFSPSSRKHYLNITLDNIVRLYPPYQSITKPSIIKLATIEDKEKENHHSFTSSNNKSEHQNKEPSIYPTSAVSSHTILTDNNTEDDFDTFFDDVDIALLDL